MNQIEQKAYNLKSCFEKFKKIYATAESCTGGMIGAAITSVPGSSKWFDRGFITYSNEAKVKMLEVDPKLIQDYGAVSAQVAEQMALGALKNSNADIAIAVTGIAGPDGGTPSKPVGTVYFGYALKNGKKGSELMSFLGNRNKVREQTVIHALDLFAKLSA